MDDVGHIVGKGGFDDEADIGSTDDARLWRAMTRGTVGIGPEQPVRAVRSALWTHQAACARRMGELPWARLAKVWLCCALAAGLLPGCARVAYDGGRQKSRRAFAAIVWCTVLCEVFP